MIYKSYAYTTKPIPVHEKTIDIENRKLRRLFDIIQSNAKRIQIRDCRLDSISRQMRRNSIKSPSIFSYFLVDTMLFASSPTLQTFAISQTDSESVHFNSLRFRTTFLTYNMCSVYGV